MIQHYSPEPVDTVIRNDRVYLVLANEFGEDVEFKEITDSAPWNPDE